jgi:hypothetical protein
VSDIVLYYMVCLNHFFMVLTFSFLLLLGQLADYQFHFRLHLGRFMAVGVMLELGSVVDVKIVRKH